jgi:hypothetical protein
MILVLEKKNLVSVQDKRYLFKHPNPWSQLPQFGSVALFCISMIPGAQGFVCRREMGSQGNQSQRCRVVLIQNRRENWVSQYTKCPSNKIHLI